jgi:hypothetical protein
VPTRFLHLALISSDELFTHRTVAVTVAAEFDFDVTNDQIGGFGSPLWYARHGH